MERLHAQRKQATRGTEEIMEAYKAAQNNAKQEHSELRTALGRKESQVEALRSELSALASNPYSMNSQLGYSSSPPSSGPPPELGHEVIMPDSPMSPEGQPHSLELQLYEQTLEAQRMREEVAKCREDKQAADERIRELQDRLKVAEKEKLRLELRVQQFSQESSTQHRAGTVGPIHQAGVSTPLAKEGGCRGASAYLLEQAFDGRRLPSSASSLSTFRGGTPGPALSNSREMPSSTSSLSIGLSSPEERR